MTETNCCHCNKPIDDGAKRIVINVSSLYEGIEMPGLEPSVYHMDCYFKWQTGLIGLSAEHMHRLAKALTDAGFTPIGSDEWILNPDDDSG